MKKNVSISQPDFSPSRQPFYRPTRFTIYITTQFDMPILGRRAAYLFRSVPRCVLRLMHCTSVLAYGRPLRPTSPSRKLTPDTGYISHSFTIFQSPSDFFLEIISWDHRVVDILVKTLKNFFENTEWCYHWKDRGQKNSLMARLFAVQQHQPVLFDSLYTLCEWLLNVKASAARACGQSRSSNISNDN